MKSGTLTLKRIFEQERRLVVPLFQRPYVWNQQDQWEPLWADIEAVANAVLAESKGKLARPHFLGAVVLDEVATPTGHLDTRLIVDGQQRLTTLQLLLEAFRDYCAGKELDRHARGIERLVRNDDPMSTDPEDVYKVWPTLVDQIHFRRVMAARHPNDLKRAYDCSEDARRVGHPLGNAYLFFYSQIDEWMGSPCDEQEIRADALYTTFRENLRMVVIDLECDDDAQVIFESLNARGTPLLPADLVKNLLFQRLRKEGGDIEKCYESEWRQFDEAEAFWRAEQGRGHAKRARIDLFLQNYLSARTAADVPTSHLYTTFRDHVERDGSTLEHLQRIRSYADVYRGFDTLSKKSREAAFFRRIRALEMASVYPFVLELFASHGKERDALVTTLIDIESYIIRRMVCGLNTRGYNRTFVDLLKSLPGKPEGLIRRVRSALLDYTANSNRWPDDKEFSRAWIERPTYWQLNQTRIRLLLEALEQDLHTSKTEAITIHDRLTIEHLLPQKWKEHWPLRNDGEDPSQATDRRNQVLQNIGNLTLLTEALNPAISNGPWGKKRSEILTHSALNLNRNLMDIWDEDTIRARAMKLLSHAKSIWPRADLPTIS